MAPGIPFFDHLDGAPTGCPSSVRTYVRARRGNEHPPRRPRLVLRVGRAAGRSPPAGPAGDRRGRGRAGGQLRGQGLRRAQRHGRGPGPAPVPVGDRGPAPHVGLLGGEQGRLRGVRRHHPAGGRDLDRRGLPRRRRAPAGVGHPLEIADPAAAPRSVERVGLPITVGVARTKFLAKVASGGGQARRAARGPRPTASSTSCTRSRSSGCGASGRSRPTSSAPGASSPWARWPACPKARSWRCSASASGRHLHALAHNRDPRPGGGRPAPPLDGVAARPRPASEVAGRHRRRRSSLSSTGSPAACAPPAGWAAPSSSGCASTTSPGPPAPTPSPGPRPTPGRSSPPPATCSPRPRP